MRRFESIVASVLRQSFSSEILWDADLLTFKFSWEPNYCDLVNKLTEFCKLKIRRTLMVSAFWIGRLYSTKRWNAAGNYYATVISKSYHESGTVIAVLITTESVALSHAWSLLRSFMLLRLVAKLEQPAPGSVQILKGVPFRIWTDPGAAAPILLHVPTGVLKKEDHSTITKVRSFGISVSSKWVGSCSLLSIPL